MVDQMKVVEIGADAIEAVLLDAPIQGLAFVAYPSKLMHAVVAALGRHGFIIENRYELPELKDGAPYSMPQKPFHVDGDNDICDANGWLVFCTAREVWEDRRALANGLCAQMNQNLGDSPDGEDP